MIEESFDLKKYKESIEKFKKFAEDSENLPYKKAEYSQEDEVNIAKFLKKVDKKAEVEKEKIDFNKSFWEKIFSSEK
jgi:hypothetical protein